MNTIKKLSKLKLLQLAVLSGLTLGATSAMAEVPAGVTTAINTAGTDAVTVATSVFVVIVGIFAIKLLRRAL